MPCILVRNYVGMSEYLYLLFPNSISMEVALASKKEQVWYIFVCACECVCVCVFLQMRVCVCGCTGADVCLRECSLTNPAWNAPPYCHLLPVWLHHIFSTFHKRHDLRKETLEYEMCILIVSANFICSISHY